MGSERVFTQSTVRKYSLMNVVSDEVADAPTKIVRKLLTVGRKYDVTLWMPSQVPPWKE
jgi:hypothetical protein